MPIAPSDDGGHGRDRTIESHCGDDESRVSRRESSVGRSPNRYGICRNADKHGVTFDAAVTVFLDSDALDGPDLLHCSAEARFRRLGMSADRRVLMVAYTLRRSADAETIRVISTRRASRRERAS
jgi:uncharacterized DUF497 family protein